MSPFVVLTLEQSLWQARNTSRPRLNTSVGVFYILLGWNGKSSWELPWSFGKSMDAPGYCGYHVATSWGFWFSWWAQGIPRRRPLLVSGFVEKALHVLTQGLGTETSMAHFCTDEGFFFFFFKAILASVIPQDASSSRACIVRSTEYSWEPAPDEINQSRSNDAPTVGP